MGERNGDVIQEMGEMGEFSNICWKNRDVLNGEICNGKETGGMGDN